jgi:hypothetical protein
MNKVNTRSWGAFISVKNFLKVFGNLEIKTEILQIVLFIFLSSKKWQKYSNGAFVIRNLEINFIGK